MDPVGIGLFLLTALVGSYVQSVTGFAMGMIMIAVTVGAGRFPVPVITAVVSLLTLVNITLALRGHLHHLDRRLLLRLAPELAPGRIVLGALAARQAPRLPSALQLVEDLADVHLEEMVTAAASGHRLPPPVG